MPPLGLPLLPFPPIPLLKVRVRAKVKVRVSAIKVEVGAKVLLSEGTTSPQPLPVGCRLQQFVVGWDNLTEDSYIHRLIREGYRIQFIRPPPLSLYPREVVPPQDLSRRLAIFQQVQQLVSNQVLIRVDPTDSIRIS
jgi:hypothetical protein